MSQEISQAANGILHGLKIVAVDGHLTRPSHVEMVHLPARPGADRFFIYGMGKTPLQRAMGGDVEFQLTSDGFGAISSLLTRPATTSAVDGGGPVLSMLIRGLANVTTSALSRLPTIGWRQAWEWNSPWVWRPLTRIVCKVWRTHGGTRLSWLLGEAPDVVRSQLETDVVLQFGREGLPRDPVARMASIARKRLFDWIRRVSREKRGSGELVDSLDAVVEAGEEASVISVLTSSEAVEDQVVNEQTTKWFRRRLRPRIRAVFDNRLDRVKDADIAKSQDRSRVRIFQIGKEIQRQARRFEIIP